MSTQAAPDNQTSAKTGRASAPSTPRPLTDECWQRLQANNAPDRNEVEPNTLKAWNHALSLLGYLDREGGKFLSNKDTGETFIQLKGETISLHISGDLDNHELEHLLFTRGLPGASSPISKPVVGYLKRFAYSCAAADIVSAKFVAISRDGQRIYVPVSDGIVMISKDGVKKARNLENPDKVIVEPIQGQRPFAFVEEPPAEGLRQLEELVIGSQTATIPEMAWLTAMQELFFVFISPMYEGERMLIAHTGPSGSAKTGSEKPYVRLHGFREATTKITPAQLQNSRYSGILFLDNQEEHNLSAALQDGLITMASGGEKQTALAHHGGERPIVSFTTIEFSLKTELKNRSVEIKHALSKEQMKKFSAQDHTEKIVAARDQIMSAVMYVLAAYLGQPKTAEEVPDGAAKFSDNYRALCRLQRAYAQTAQKPKSWADQIIAGWRQQLEQHGEIAADENLHHVVRSYFDSALPDNTKKAIPISGEELNDGTRVSGDLYVTSPTAFFEWAKNHHGSVIAHIANAQTLSRRLTEANGADLRVLREDDVPNGSQLYDHLRRRDGQRSIGLLKLKRAADAI